MPPATPLAEQRIMRERAEEGRVELVADMAFENLYMQGDERSFKQILLNLLSNAVKFTPEGGKVTVRVTNDADSNVLLEVTDTGIGMRPEDIPKAMAPFMQVDNSLAKEYQGTGLGLPLTKKLVELHDGTFEIESAPDVGTTVRICLPGSRRILLE
jgi:signal transduction histidine kinase